MSHKQPHRRTPSDTDLRPDHGPYSSSDSRHTSSDHNFYRPPQESQSSSQQSSSSSRVSAQWSQDGALSILSSCGLEPSDLSLLAELPEDVLTVESLPHVLQQMKGRRGTFKHCPPTAPSSSSSYPPGSNLQPAVRDWDQLRSQPVRYPLGQATSFPSEPVQVHWGGSRASRSVRADPPPPSSSSLTSSSLHMAYFHHRPGLSEYGKTSRATSSSSSQDRASFRSTGQRQRSRPSRFSEPGSADHRSAPPHKPQGGHLQPETSPVSQQALTASMPSIKEALDFHGTSPRVHPYSCSLCDITVLSERDWAKHINSTQHADGQLNLLQRCPKWDCRMETVSRANNQSERKDEEEAPWPPQTANQRQKPQLNKQKKASDKGKVVCVKFPAQSVDEAYLRKLIDPFGKIIKILMFPSLAFVELGSVDQAKDLVTFHVNYPPTVNGEQIQFSISSTFHFLQSSRVVSFCPAPTGDDSRSDLISIIKRFGPPLYTLFLPSRAFVEMKNAPDAQKMVDYYSSNILRINSDALKVSFSGEYKSLMHVASAQKYEEGETASTKKEGNQIEEKEMGKDTKRKRNESQEKEMKRRSSSKDRTEQRSSTERRTRSRSRGRSRRDRSMSSRSRDRSSTERRTRSRSRERSSRDRRTKTRSKSREKLKDYGSREEPEKLDSESRTDPEPDPVSEFRPGPAENEQSEEEAESSTYNSDIEGMEVIGEDLEEEEEEEEEEEDVEEDAYRGSSSPAERSDSPEEGRKRTQVL
uniref:Uncharacterized protein n=1 Tax=Echeneis naucrates TaxID=173247 RepID=A0A665UL42_ECHNA